MATQLGIKVHEVNLKLTDLLQADEVFITNSLIEIVPVTTFDGKPIANGKPGTVTGKLMKAYKALVKKETTNTK
jgi:branched-chain amino acid aminotransferase